MIVGIGIDLCEIARMEKLLKDGRFLGRYFAPEEQEYIEARGRCAAASMAGIFAAKEALAKALGMGLSGGDISGVCVLHDKFGAPYLDLRGDFAHLAAQKNVQALHLSITHENGMAAAMVIAEREKG